MNKKLSAALVIAVLALTGCATAGNQVLKNETETTIKTKITENKTTKTEVKNQFGSPDETSFTDNGKEIWKYEFANMSADGVNYIPIVNLFGSSSSGTKKQLVIMFDGDVVSKYSMSESAHSVKTGAFR
ncbi:MAG: hypothetical protein LBE52_04200 [Providencia sp.]|jgi:outer membrane protein assembly factor BamE (lipoprotein component of BamABCDE complex)|nr:hypothetical protein [Providencia sp.]